MSDSNQCGMNILREKLKENPNTWSLKKNENKKKIQIHNFITTKLGPIL
jgi:hypothetical protein